MQAGNERHPVQMLTHDRLCVAMSTNKGARVLKQYTVLACQQEIVAQEPVGFKSVGQLRELRPVQALPLDCWICTVVAELHAVDGVRLHAQQLRVGMMRVGMMHQDVCRESDFELDAPLAWRIWRHYQSQQQSLSVRLNTRNVC